MAYVIGIMTKDELVEAIRNGYEPEAPPTSLIPDEMDHENNVMVQFWLDCAVTDLLCPTATEEDKEYSQEEAEKIAADFIEKLSGGSNG